MAFTFEITAVNKFPDLRLGILDGKLVDGYVKIGAVAHLVRGTRRLPMRVKSVVLDSQGPDDLISLTFDLRDEAMEIAEVGDRVDGTGEGAEGQTHRQRVQPGRRRHASEVRRD